jgi:hypothetical protein
MTSAISFEALGLTKEDLQERVIERIVEKSLLTLSFADPESDDTVQVPSVLSKQIDKRIKEHIEATINALAEKHILPNVSQYIENLTLQKTTEWGEKVGKPMTFLEYMIQRAEAHIQEPVDRSGQTKEQAGYNWSKSTTRIAFLVNSHLQYNIETAMKQALTTANAAIVGGIEQAVKIKLDEVAKSMKVNVAIR